MKEEKRYVVAYTAFEEGIITNAGCFDYADKTHAEASAKMVKDYEETLAQLKDCSNYPENLDAEISKETIDGEDLPVLCVIRDFNGTDNDIFTWTVWPVYI